MVLALPRTAAAAAAGTAAAETELSAGQSALWYLHALAPQSGAYHVFGLVRVRPQLDAALLAATLRRLAARHPLLRASVHGGDAGPRLHVAAAAEDLPLDFVAEPEPAAPELDERLREAVYVPFDLARGPLLRARAFGGAGDSTVVLLVAHHLIADFWSLVLLMQELAALYPAGAAASGSAGSSADPASAALPPPARTFADFVAAQRQLLAGERGEQLWHYWQERLRGPLAQLELPADRPRPALLGDGGAVRSLRLPAAAFNAVRGLARAHRTNSFGVLLGLFQVLLGRLSGQDDILVGSPVSGRAGRAWAGVVGYFVNPVVLRADLAGDPRLTDFLARHGLALRADLAHHELPFPILAERLQPLRDAGRSPLFQVMFAQQKVPLLPAADVAGFALGEAGSRMRLGGFDFESMDFAHRTAQFDLTLLTAEGAGGQLCLSCQHSTELYDGNTVERLLGRFAALIDAAAADPQRPLSALPLLSAAESHQLLESWNATGTTGAPEPLHAAFFRQAQRQPQAAAIEWRGQWLTYGALAARAAHLAAHLRALGVGPEVRAGVCLDRTPDLVAALLAVLAAGGAYLPLDPAYPAERLALLAADAAPLLVITSPALAARLPSGAFTVLCLDGPQIAAAPPPVAAPHLAAPPPAALAALPLPDALAAPTPLAAPAAPPLPTVPDPGNLAYLIYTSGSTGRPKGVAIEHRSACALVRWAAALFTPAELAATLAATSINFDLSVFEIFVPLSQGGRLVLVDNALDLPAAAGSGVTLVNTVPSALAQLLRQNALPRSVLTVNLAGEPLRRGLVADAYRAQGAQAERVYNLYGPSETTTYSTWELTAADEPDPPAIGRPIQGTRAHVMDRHGQPAVPGAVGELWLGGEGLARGYLNRPDATAERFVPDPTGRSGERLYRTGDLARHLPDGRLALLGRRDHQVKIRGHRVELEEVELALDRHPQVLEAAAAARPDSSGELALVAYVVTRPAPAGAPAAPPTAAELRAFLRQSLPEALVPSRFEPLAALPRTPNGKLDRHALPRLAAGGPAPDAAATAAAAPLTPTEEILTAIWREVLGVTAAAPGDDFFDLGGHSLLAAQVAARLGRAVGREVPLREVMEARTLAALAARTDAAVAAGDWPSASPLGGGERRQVQPASFGQGRLWLLHRLAPDSPAYHLAAAVRLRGPLAPAALAAALNSLTTRHEALRTTFADGAAGVEQHIQAPAPLLLPVVDLAALPAGRRPAAAGALAAAAVRHPFDLAVDRPLRAVLLATGRDDHELVLTLHHIAADHASLEILTREIGALYAAALAGSPSPLAALSLQYADFAAWQRRWWTGERLAGRLAWWQERLHGMASLDLPADARRGTAAAAHRSGRLSFTVPAEVAAHLHRLGRGQGATLFMVLLAAFQALLSRLSGQEDVAVATPVAGRDRAELEGLVGFFVNTLVLRTTVAADTAAAGLVAQAREVALSAFAHQDLPFDKLAEAMGRTDLARVMLVFQGRALERLPIAGLATEIREVDVGAAKFDLTLNLDRRQGGELAGWFEHDRGVLSAAVVERWSGSFSLLLAGMAAEPRRPLAALPLLSAAESHQLLESWNATGTTGAPEPLHAAFFRQAQRQPQAAAIEWRGQWLTYGALAARAAHLAAHLRALGVGPEVRAGVCLDRTPDLVAALLAVLAAGGAYLPLDPAYPAERLALLAADAAPLLVVTSQALAARLPAGAFTVVCPDGPQIAAAPPSFAALASQSLGALTASLPATALTAPLPAAALTASQSPGALAASPPSAALAASPPSAALAASPPSAALAASPPSAALAASPPALAPPPASAALAAPPRPDALAAPPPFAAPAAPPLPAVPDPGNLAYLIYTSGSTGRPKGVAIEHRSACALVRWAAALFTPAELAATLAATSINFDLSVFEIFVPLSQGGRLVLVDNALDLPAAAGSGVTLVNTVPSALAQLLRQNALPPSVLTVNLAGEPLRRSLVADAYRAQGARVERVYNLYGPSETTTYSTWELTAADEPDPPPIGRPIRGTRAHVMDRHGQPAMPGAVGELWLGGEGLARGYLNRPDATAERFVPDPTGRSGERLYRTGDLARHLPDGRLVLLGRRDHQVKIRGHRVELEEVELALDRHPQVLEAAAAARPDSSGELALVAYVVTRPAPAPAGAPAAPPTAAELRAFLRQSLPEALVPSRFEPIAALPRTPNGKLDRHALPRLAAGGPAPDAAATAAVPLTPTEEILTAIWQEVLGVAAAGPGDDFFDLGGHSLLAMQLVSRLRERFGVDLTPREVFEHPRLAALAHRLEQAMAGAAGRPAPAALAAFAAARRTGRTGAPPVPSFAQERLWFLAQIEPDSAAYLIPLAARLAGTVHLACLAAALREVVRRHSVLRGSFPATADGQPHLAIAPPTAAAASPLPAEIDLTALPEAHRRRESPRLAGHAARHPLPLETGPPLRCWLVRLAAGDSLLLLTVHHIAADAWSLGLLLGELDALYAAARAAAPSPLPPLPLQYEDFAAWQRHWLSGDRLAAQLDYWRRRLDGAPALLQLPADRPRPAVASGRGARLPLVLDPHLGPALRAAGREQGATLFMVLLAGFAVLLGRAAGADDLTVGTPISGRSHRETEPLLGLFVNTLVLRVGLAGAPTFGHLLAGVRALCLEAYLHQDLPFERLVVELAPERSLAATPLFQVMLALQNEPRHAPALGDLTLAPLALDGGTAKFDLLLSLHEGAAGGLAGACEYATDLFDRATVQRLTAHLAVLLTAAAAAPARTVDSLPLLTPAEEHQLRHEWSGSPPPDAAAGALPSAHALFARRARSAPQATAVRDAAGSLTYGELAGRAHRLAGRLVALGVAPDVPVAILAPASRRFLVAVLAVLEAGGAYVPLDPAYPPARIAYMLADCGAPVLLIDGPRPFAPPAGRPLAVVDLASPNLAALGLAGPAPAAPVLAAPALAARSVVSPDLAASVLAAPALAARSVVSPDLAASALAASDLASPNLAALGLAVPAPAAPFLAAPALAAPSLTSPDLTSPDLAAPGLAAPNLAAPSLASPDLAAPGLAVPAPAAPFLAAPALAAPSLASPGLGSSDLAASDLASPNLAALGLAVPAPAAPFLAAPALAAPSLPSPDLASSGLASPDLAAPGLASSDLAVPGLDAASATDARGGSWATAADAAAAGGDHLAYVLYTSGSTGRPKGVAMPHRALANLLAWQAAALPTPAGSRTLQFAPVSFDVSFQEIFSTLAAGGELVLVDETTRREPDRLLAVVAAERVDRVYVPMAALAALAETAEVARPPAAPPRQVVSAGEQLRVTPQLAAWLAPAGAPPAALHNHYGPTETHVVTAWTAVGPAADWPPLPPIGRPISGACLYLFDARLAPLPAGTAGELYIGGACLARGYLGRPDLTAERFVPDPAGDPPGARLYRTGDLARHAADGTLHFLGRIDHQVKLRGFRIELGEVEAMLCRHPGVAAAAAAVRQPPPPAAPRLVAWVVTAADGPHPEELRRWLAGQLPEYMLPSALVPVDALPLTPSGKVDKARLPDPPAAAAAAAAAGNPFEEIVAGVWCDLLGRDAVAAGDDFFALGGHSLIATQLAARLRRLVDLPVPVRAVFEHPTLAAFARELGRLERAALDTAPPLDDTAPPPAAAAPPPLVRIARDQPLPLSFAQERLWFLDQLDGASPLFNLPVSLLLEGELDAGALAAAIGRIVGRHEALRTTFAAAGGVPRQVIAPPPPAFALPRVDLAGLPPAARGAEVHRLAAAAALRPFDLARGPLLRTTLLRLTGSEHVLLLDVHHIAADGGSMGIFLAELAALYAAPLATPAAAPPPLSATPAAAAPPPPATPAAVAPPPPATPAAAAPPLPATPAAAAPPPLLAALPVQYADFAAWQRRVFAGDTLAAGLAFWRRTLAGAPAVLELPADRQRPAVQSLAGGRRRISLAPAAAAGLRARARASGVTLFMTLLAIYAAWLARVTGRRDLVVGTPAASRDEPALVPLIGLFINNLVLRLDLAGDPGWGEILSRVRAAALAAYAHQAVPFEKLVEELRPLRDLSHTPIYQVVLAFDTTPRAPLDLGGLRLTPLAAAAAATAKYDLTLYLDDRDGRLGGALEYSTALFDPATAARFASHLEVLAAHLAAEPAAGPGTRLSHLPLVTAAELHQLRVELNDTGAAAPAETFVHRAIAARAALSPAAPAVAWRGRLLTYGELDAQANRLARRLRALGVGPEVRVALALDRAPELIAAILGIWKAGGVYVPLDIAYPRERQETILADAGAAVLLTLPDLLPRLPCPAAVTVLALTPGWPELAAEPAAAPPAGDGLQSGSLAYVIYTSGSTGRPRGVMVTHAGLASYTATAVAAYGLTPADRVLQFCALGFDISIEEIVPTLVCGARLVLRTDEILASIPDFFAACRDWGLTLLSLPTAFWHEIVVRLDALDLGLPPTLRLIIIAGERALPEHLQTWLRHAPRRPRLVNTYGLTESTIISTLADLTAAPPAAGREVPIGRVIPDTEIHLLDAAFAPVPIGVPGELFIGGGLLARGYLGRPDTTALRFVPHPFAAAPGERLYRTGDLARLLGGGELEFIGRADHQVKIRGYRIELEEVEAALAAHPAVETALVAAPEERPGQRRLVAYVVAADRGQPPAAAELHAFLARGLPEYMLPAAFVFLPAPPLSANGKLDRGALPAAGAAATPLAEYAAPRDEIERQIAAIWQEALGVERIGIYDSFFQAGGHSLLLIRVQEGLRQRFGRGVSMVDLFRHPTIDALARLFADAAPPAPGADDLRRRAEQRVERGRTLAPPGRAAAARRKVKAGAPAASAPAAPAPAPAAPAQASAAAAPGLAASTPAASAPSVLALPPPAPALDPRLHAAHAGLSRAAGDFLRFVAANPECQERRSFALLDERPPLSPFPLQPWPALIDRTRYTAMERVSSGLSALIKSLPRRLFDNDPRRLAEFYGLPGAEAARALLDEPSGIASALGRGDFLLTTAGLQCLEFNMLSYLGGWHASLLAELFLRVPVWERFVAATGLRLTCRDTLGALFAHLLDEARPLAAADGEINTAFIVPDAGLPAGGPSGPSGPDGPGGAGPAADPLSASLASAYARALAAAPAAGRLVVRRYAELAERRGLLYDGDRRLHAVVEAHHQGTAAHVYRCFKGGTVNLYNAPVRAVLTDKRNLALLSAGAGDAAFTAAERELVARHVPWTRTFAAVAAEWRGRTVFLPELARAERAELVLKRAREGRGDGVHVGLATPPAEWEARLAAALADGDWVLQERLASLPFLFQHGPAGSAPHDVVWGLFVFGSRPGGGFLSVSPQGTAVVNLHRGASEGLLFEVAD